jgi:ubiquitin C-terminal hydrolase
MPMPANVRALEILWAAMQDSPADEDDNEATQAVAQHARLNLQQTLTLLQGGSVDLQQVQQWCDQEHARGHNRSQKGGADDAENKGGNEAGAPSEAEAGTEARAEEKPQLRRRRQRVLESKGVLSDRLLRSREQWRRRQQQHFLQRCVLNLTRHESVPQSLQLMRGIVSSFPEQAAAAALATAETGGSVDSKPVAIAVAVAEDAGVGAATAVAVAQATAEEVVDNALGENTVVAVEEARAVGGGESSAGYGTQPMQRSAAIVGLETSQQLLHLFFEDLVALKTQAALFVMGRADGDRGTQKKRTLSDPKEIQRMEQDLDEWVRTTGSRGSSYGYIAQLEERLEFLDFILCSSPLRLGYERVAMLWSALHLEALLPAESELFLRWLRGNCPRGSSSDPTDSGGSSPQDGKHLSTNLRHTVALDDGGNTVVALDDGLALDDGVAERLFEEQLSNGEYTRSDKCSLPGFRCFERFFRHVNEQRGIICELGSDGSDGSGSGGSSGGSSGSHDTQSFEILSLKLRGLSVLWEMVLGARDDEVVTQATAFLTSLPQRLAASLQDQLGAFRVQYVKVCMQHLLQASRAEEPGEGVQQMGRCLAVLRLLLKQARDELGVPASLLFKSHALACCSSRDRGELMLLNVNNNVRGSPTLGQRPQLSIHRNDTASQLLLGVSRVVKRPAGQIRLFSSGREVHCVGIHHSSKTLADLHVKNGDAVLAYIRMTVPKKKAEQLGQQEETQAEAQADEGEGGLEEERYAEAEKEELRRAMLAVEQLPHVTLSSCHEYRSLLFELVDGGFRCSTPSMQCQAWEILLQLPTDPQLSQDLEEMTPGWSKSLHSDLTSACSWSRRLYLLQTVQSLVCATDEDCLPFTGNGSSLSTEQRDSVAGMAEGTRSWLSRFLAQGGVGKLCQCFADTAKVGGGDGIEDVVNNVSIAADPPVPPSETGARRTGVAGRHTAADKDTFTEGQRLSCITLLLQLLQTLVVSAIKTTVPTLCVDPKFPADSATLESATADTGGGIAAMEADAKEATNATLPTAVGAEGGEGGDGRTVQMGVDEATLVLQQIKPCTNQLQQYLFTVLDGVTGGRAGGRGGGRVGGGSFGSKELVVAVESACRLWVALCVYWPSLFRQLRCSSWSQDVLVQLLFMPDQSEAAPAIRKCVASSLRYVCSCARTADEGNGDEGGNGDKGGNGDESDGADDTAGDESATSSAFSTRLFVLQMLLEHIPGVPSSQSMTAQAEARIQASKVYFSLVTRLLEDALRAELVESAAATAAATSQANGDSFAAYLTQVNQTTDEAESPKKLAVGEGAGLISQIGEGAGLAFAISESGCDLYLLVRLLAAKLRAAPVVETYEVTSAEVEDVVLHGTLNLLHVALSHAMTATTPTAQKDAKYGLLAFAGTTLAEGDQGGTGCGLVRELFCRCLFAIPGPLSAVEPPGGAQESSLRPSLQLGWQKERAAMLTGYPRCKCETSRAAALELLGMLCSGCEQNAHELIGLLGPMVVQRGDRELSWGCEPAAVRKSSTGYAGITNLGCICFMNAMLQQLFMMPTLRYALLGVRVEASAEELKQQRETDAATAAAATAVPTNEAEEKADSIGYKSEILRQLQRLFGRLLLTEKQAVNPVEWCRAFKGSFSGGRPINVRVQQDTNEFMTQFCDQVEEELGKVSKEQKGLLFGCLEVQLVSQLLCYKQVDDGRQLLQSRETPEGAPYISLDVSNQKNGLLGSLDFFFQEESVDFNWKDSEDKGVGYDGPLKTIKRYCVEELPDTVWFHLKRFELDYETFLRGKVNDYFDFPYELDLFPYTKEGKAWAENVAPGGAENVAPEGDEAEAAGQSKYKLHPREYYCFKLVGCVVHTGSIDSGHYYSFIKERSTGESAAGSSTGESTAGSVDQDQKGKSERWLEFNDEMVQVCDLSDPQMLREECFGGQRVVKEYNQFLSKTVERKVTNHKSAFMLVYERDVKFAPSVPSPDDGSCASTSGAEDSVDRNDKNGVSKIDDPQCSDDATNRHDPQCSDGLYPQCSVLRRSESGIDRAEFMPSSVFSETVNDNISWLHATYLFSASFADFMLVLTQKTTPAPVLGYTPVSTVERNGVGASLGFETDLLLILAQYMVEVLAHSNHAHLFTDFAAALGGKFKRNTPACIRLLEQYTRSTCGQRTSHAESSSNGGSSTSTLAELLLNCPLQYVRLAFARFMLIVLSTVTQFEESFLAETEPCPSAAPSVSGAGAEGAEDNGGSQGDEEDDVDGGSSPTKGAQFRAVSSRFLSVCMCSMEAMEEVAHGWRSFGEWQWLLWQWGSLGRPHRCFLVQQRMVMRLIDMILGAQSPLTDAEAGYAAEETRKRPPPMAHVAGRIIAPDWTHPLALLSLLVRSCPTQVADAAEPSFPVTMIETDNGVDGLSSKWVLLDGLSQKCILTKTL